MAKLTEVHVPDIGEFSDVPIIEILVAPGDTVALEDALVTLESDKASMDVPAPAAGRIKELKVALGDRVSEGSLILTMEPEETSDAPALPAPSAPAPVPADLIEVRVPDLGDFSDVPIIEVLVGAGDSVDVDDSLITLESDKASMDVPAPRAGRVSEVLVSVGDRVSQGDLIVNLTAAPGAAVPAPPDEARARSAVPDAEPAPHPPGTLPGSEAIGLVPCAPAHRGSPTATFAPCGAHERAAYASPSVRRFARELGVSLASVTGTGRKGRIIREDVQRFVKESLSRAPESAPGFSAPQMPAIDFSRYGAVQIEPLARIEKLSGANLHRAWLVVPHVTQHDEADVTELETFRKSLAEKAKQDGFRLTLLAFIMKACVAALKHHPTFNASLDPAGENLILKHYFHLGVAVDTPDGLVVPVIREVDQKGVETLARELGEVSARARARKLSPADMQGGCFTISSLGGIGGTAFTPIVNAPEVAILGVSRTKLAPVFDGTDFVPRLILPLSLSYDHRVIDGAAAARFTRDLCELLEDTRKLLL